MIEPDLAVEAPAKAIATPVRKRAYDAAMQSRQGGHWLSTIRSADAEIWSESRTLRDRSRSLVRNNPFAAKAVASLASNIVGEGVVPRPASGSAARDKKVWEAFQRWSYRCDHSGQLDFYGMQTLLVREMIEGGEVLIRKRLRKKSGRPGDVPLELQVLEADFLDPSRNGILTEGTLTIQGVEIDIDSQKRVAYWLYPFHPGGMPFYATGQPMQSSPVSADEVLHVYEQQRVQTRGVPWGTPAIEGLGLLADYELAEVVRKKMEACVVGIVSGAESEDEDSVGIQVTDADGCTVEKFEPGMVLRAHGAKQVTFNTPTAVGGYGEYRVTSLQAISAAYRMPYELVAGDLSKVNFSSMRGGLVEFRRLVGTVQWQILIQLALQPIWEWWCEAAWLAGVIDTPYVPVEWSPPEFEWVDPQADAQTAAIEVRNGFRTWQDVVAEKGRNPDEVLEGIRAYNEKVDAMGITLDSDPRRTTAQGLQQKVETKDGGGPSEIGRPNRGLRHGKRAGEPAPVRARRAVPGGKLQPGRQHDRDRLDDGRERSPHRLLGRHRVR